MADQHRKIAVIQYADPSLIPEQMRPLGIIAVDLPEIAHLDITYYNDGDTIPGHLQVCGGVLYNTLGDMVESLTPVFRVV